MALNSMFGGSTGQQTYPWLQQSTAPSNPTGGYANVISGVTYDPTKVTREETPIGVDTWSNAFSGLDQYGLGAFGSISPMGDPNNPSGFTIRREDPNGDPMMYQNRNMTINPDGTVSWNGDWTNAQRVSDSQFWRDGLALVAAGAGAAGYLGSTIAGGAAGGGLGGLSGMDLAADGGINSITNAGSMLGTAGGAVGGTGLTMPGAGAATGSGLNLSGAAPGSVFGTGEGLAIAPGAVGAASGGTGLGSMIGSTIPAASELPGFLSTLGGGTATAGGGSGLVNRGLGKAVGTVGSNVVKDLVGNVLGGSSGGISNIGNLASLFTNYNQYNKMGDLINEIKGIYSPDGVYAKRLGEELARKDAAAGRNSQYGPRTTELMARLGDSQARALSGLGGFMSTQQGGLNGMVGAGGRLLDGTGLGGLISGGLQSLFGNQGGMLAGEAGTTPSIWDRPAEDIDWEELWGG